MVGTHTIEAVTWSFLGHIAFALDFHYWNPLSSLFAVEEIAFDSSYSNSSDGAWRITAVANDLDTIHSTCSMYPWLDDFHELFYTGINQIVVLPSITPRVWGCSTRGSIVSYATFRIIIHGYYPSQITQSYTYLCLLPMYHKAMYKNSACNGHTPARKIRVCLVRPPPVYMMRLCCFCRIIFYTKDMQLNDGWLHRFFVCTTLFQGILTHSR